MIKAFFIVRLDKLSLRSNMITNQTKKSTKNLLEVREQIQEDLITLLSNRIDNNTMTKVCQIVVDNMNSVIKKHNEYNI
jgi:hypothetical protein